MKPIYVYFTAHAVLLLIGAITSQLTYPLASAVGVGIVAAAVSGGIIGLYVISSENVARLHETLRIFGFENAWEGRGARIRKEYESHLGSLQSNLDVLGFGLRAFREDFGSQFNKWSTKAKIRVLVLDPEFPKPDFSLATQRDSEEKNPRDTIATDVREFIREFRDLVHDPSREFEIRLFQCLPSINIFRVDQHMFWGPYLVNTQSRNTPTFKIKAGRPLFETFLEHFEQIWREYSREVPAEWFDERS